MADKRPAPDIQAMARQKLAEVVQEIARRQDDGTLTAADVVVMGTITKALAQRLKRARQG